jgi:hypothetical protein
MQTTTLTPEEVIPPGQLGPAAVEQIFLTLFTQTYQEGSFASVNELISAMAAVVRKEFGVFMVEVEPSEPNASSRLN